MIGYVVYNLSLSKTLTSKWNWEANAGDFSNIFSQEELDELRSTDIGDWSQIRPVYVRKTWLSGHERAYGQLEPFWI
jgi:hypothetical protein